MLCKLHNIFFILKFGYQNTQLLINYLIKTLHQVLLP